MFWRKKKHKERLPWYRAPRYKGNLTEDEKRELDSFRLRENRGEKHPAASFEDLPEEVTSYVSKLEVERYDLIQETLVGRCFLVSGIGAFVLANHLGWISPDYHSAEMLLFATVLLVAPWVYYPIKWRKNADQFSLNLGDESLRTAWELEYIVNKNMQARKD